MALRPPVPVCSAGGQLVKDELGISLDKADDSILGLAAKVGRGRARGDAQFCRGAEPA